MNTLDWNQLSAAEQAAALRRPALAQSGREAQVADIIARVRDGGDAALLDLTRTLDRAERDSLQLTDAEITAAAERVSPQLKAAIELAIGNIEAFHQAQLPEAVIQDTSPGVRCELHFQPIEKVGLYVPGGSAPLVSTVMMLAIPARLAGCARVVLCSPPPINDAIVYTAKRCGVDAIYTLGGAQAIAAMAYGSETVTKVDKIFGPGNAWVTEAKQQVSSDVDGAAIDMPAGPSEVLVIADEFADADFIAADLLSQAEHGPDSQVILVTPSRDFAGKVDEALARQLAELSRADIARQALAESRTFICRDLEQAAAISNAYAPEHLIVQTEHPRALLPRLKNAGSIFLGAWTPESVGDYASGTNHTLPTYGYARTYSSLGLADYQRRYTVQELSPEGLRAIGPAVELLAATETLDAHKNAVSLRLAKLEKHA
ncbi:histidinol dehydrogenase [Oceanimonas sp. GK1]|uniref:histidinol dehydrogenase n=1 Tax=Oceanimonas sp. (strain GK1 / IBRC-M 10197) TaxID=511062 RepID=UPI0002495035|nr:histidinol dehydrogenase [Oceanimonas sp. GK1]AEY01758.1 histidinol dehydrogenase [Oceanimonas sp. GK1]